MLQSWTSHIKDKELKEDFRLEIIASRRVLKRLSQLIENKQSSSVTGMKKKTNFKDPNWTHSMADSLGYQRAIDEIQELLEVK